MTFKKYGIGALLTIALAGAATAAVALPVDWQTGFQSAASPVMDQIESFHRELFYIITAVCIFVLALLWLTSSWLPPRQAPNEIGRASCRERVYACV